jgi:tRNA(adenine34) deaminase
VFVFNNSPEDRSVIASSADVRWMSAAIAQARVAQREGDVPIGALIVYGDQDPTAHAEVLAIREAAGVRDSWRLSGCTLYVTLEPCAMCAGAIVLARIDRVVFGAWDPKAGMVGSIGDLVRHPKLNHRAQVLGGVLEEECGELLRDFFATRRVTK